MPIYEFYCKRCNTLYNFFSIKVNTSKIPLCPRCKNVRLARKMSVFAALTGAENEQDSRPFNGLGETRMTEKLVGIVADAEKIGGDDPRAAAQLMRKFTESTGMKMGDSFHEALRRIERGEEPEKVEEDMADALMREEPFADKKKTRKSSVAKMIIDETLYEL